LALLGLITSSGEADAISPAQFSTLPPHAPLPGGQICARLVTQTPETIPGNVPFNRRVPTPSELIAFHLWASRAGAGAPYFDRVDGNYTGSTAMILRWAACKWGISEDVARAQAWTESKWIQGGINPAAGGGDKRVKISECVRNGFNALWDFSCDNCCYQSWGILQTKVYYAPQTWPMIKDSTAFNADYRYAEERACIDGGNLGYFASDAQQPNTYAVDIAHGDLDRLLWGCTGMHFSGSWYDSPALGYIQETRRYIVTKPWSKMH
jgi:autotransporter family porin